MKIILRRLFLWFPDHRNLFARNLVPLLVIAVLALLTGCGGGTTVTHAVATTRAATAPTVTSPADLPGRGSAHSPTFGLPPVGYVAPRGVTSTATAEMFDSVTVSAIPSWARAVAGYLPPSSWPTFTALVRDFAHAVHVPIAVQASVIIRGVRMGCLDVEPGDAVPSQAAAWIRAEISVHVKPCLYSNLSEWSQVQADLTAAAIPRTAYFKWLALWVFHPGLTPGYDAQQWTEVALRRNLDESTASLAFLGLVPAPKPKPSNAQVAKWKGALASSTDQYTFRGCATLHQRAVWFGAREHGHLAARHKRAARASVRAYNDRACPVFEQRVHYFTAKLAGR
jgi:hypothetical protein